MSHLSTFGPSRTMAHMQWAGKSRVRGEVEEMARRWTLMDIAGLDLDWIWIGYDWIWIGFGFILTQPKIWSYYNESSIYISFWNWLKAMHQPQSFHTTRSWSLCLGLSSAATHMIFMIYIYIYSFNILYSKGFVPFSSGAQQFQALYKAYPLHPKQLHESLTERNWQLQAQGDDLINEAFTSLDVLRKNSLGSREFRRWNLQSRMSLRSYLNWVESPPRNSRDRRKVPVDKRQSCLRSSVLEVESTKRPLEPFAFPRHGTLNLSSGDLSQALRGVDWIWRRCLYPQQLPWN